MDLRKEYNLLSDEALAAKFREGERRVSFTIIVERYQKRIYFSARKLVGGDHDEADEISQETFVKVYEALDSFRGESKLYTWIYRIMMNAVIYRSRRKKVRKHTGIEEIQETLADDGFSSDQLLEKQEMTATIEEAIAQLPDKQREVFVLRFYDEMPYEDISVMLGTSVGGLKANYFHAVEKVGKYVRSKVERRSEV
ncbi:MAG: sigma-70 family RNA polymerase sigma factor [bacterium]